MGSNNTMAWGKIASISASIGGLFVIVLAVMGAGERIANAESSIRSNTKAIGELTKATRTLNETTSQLGEIIRNQEAARKATQENNARLCMNGTIGRDWCLSNQHKVPR